MRESHPYRKVSDRKHTACNLSITSLKSACHRFIVMHDWDGSVCSCGFYLRHSRSPVLQFLTWGGFPFSMTFTLFSFVSFSPCFSRSSAFPQIFLFPGASSPPLRSSAESAVAFITSLLLRLPFLPLSSWRPYLSTV